jgi:DNA-binding MarR family transcriptional regulator
MAKPKTAESKTRPLLTGQATRSRQPAPADAHLELKIWLRLLNISNQIKRTLAARLRQDFDTSMARFDLLAQLERAAPHGLSMTALSARVMVTNGAITGLVDGLVRDGLVTRAGHSRDRRTVIVGLTPLGRRRFLVMARRHEQWVRDLFAGLPNQFKSEFQDRLAMMKRQLPVAAPSTARRLTLRGDEH